MKNNETKHTTLRVFFFRMVFHLLLRKFLSKDFWPKGRNFFGDQKICAGDQI